MMITDPNDPEKEIEVYTAEEKVAIETERDAAKAEVERLGKVTAEKTENFKKLNEMNEQEKAQFTAKEIENMKRVEAAEARTADLEATITGDKQKRIDSDTTAALAKYHGKDAKLKEALEANFKLIALPGDDTETINKRAEMAASMLRGSTNALNPLMISFGGSAPRNVEGTESEAFMKSDKAANALNLMNYKPEEKK